MRVEPMKEEEGRVALQVPVGAGGVWVRVIFMGKPDAGAVEEAAETLRALEGREFLARLAPVYCGRCGEKVITVSGQEVRCANGCAGP